MEAGTKDLRSRPVLIGRQPHTHTTALPASTLRSPDNNPTGHPRRGEHPPRGHQHDRTQHNRTQHRAPAHRDHNASPPPPHTRGPVRGEKVTAAIAWGKRPDPSRTRKLSPTAPMVLHPPGCGRVGHRRTTPHAEGPTTTVGPSPHLRRPPQHAGPRAPRAQPASPFRVQKTTPTAVSGTDHPYPKRDASVREAPPNRLGYANPPPQAPRVQKLAPRGVSGTDHLYPKRAGPPAHWAAPVAEFSLWPPRRSRMTFALPAARCSRSTSMSRGQHERQAWLRPSGRRVH